MHPIQKGSATTLAKLRELLTPIPSDLGGCDRALLLISFNRTLRRSDLAGILLSHLVRTDLGSELTLELNKVSQVDVMLMPLPLRRTEL